ncbi:MAG: dihydrodipicolinate reductase [Nitrospinota bacterium]|nr:MAG: dihydrodipicolinate reductase [Nitrospinota bacterium]
MEQSIRVICYGLGPIGMGVARHLLTKRGYTIVGAVDIAPDKVGKDLGRLLDLDRELGIVVRNDPPDLFAQVKADVVLHTTASFLPRVYPQLIEILQAGMHVISTTEELAFPSLQHPDLARELDQIARQQGVTLLGTGVNPGFVMDRLVLTLSGVCQHIDHIRALRVVDAAQRRLPLQRKIGAGLTPEEFQAKSQREKIGHIGLIESVALIAHGLQWELKDIQETVTPVIAERHVQTPYLEVPPGAVAGIRHTARGIVGGEARIELELQMYVGAEDPRDVITISGVPPLQMTLAGGIMGDQATVAIVVNSIPVVLKSPPGLQTVIDLPAPLLIP